jgi:hypothetical protein
MHTVLPAEIGSEGFDLVAWGKEGPENSGVGPSEPVALITVVHRQLLLSLILDNSSHFFDILNPALHPKSPSSTVVFLSMSRRVLALFPVLLE